MAKLNCLRKNRMKLVLIAATLVILWQVGCISNALARPEKIDLATIKSPIILRGDETTAYRDPTCIYHLRFRNSNNTSCTISSRDDSLKPKYAPKFNLRFSF